MKSIRFEHVEAFWLLFGVLAVLLPAWLWNFWGKRRAMRRLAEAPLHPTINRSAGLGRQVLKALLLTAAFAAVVLALTRPGWNPRPRPIERQGRDIVILLDTSRSMLAEDIRPNRLERAKLAISDLMESLQGDRIGIITFAGATTLKCPLTQDYGFVRMILSEIDTESTIRGGTSIGDAIRDAVERVFEEDAMKYKDIILITDGGDQESFPEQAAARAGEKGIRIIAVGLGDNEQGARIPVTDEQGRRTFLTYEGQEVWTRLGEVEEQTLRSIAAATPDGRYIPVRTGAFDLGRIYSDLIAEAERRALESTEAIQYEERFQVFIALAIVLVVAEGWISERRKTAD